MITSHSCSISSSFSVDSPMIFSPSIAVACHSIHSRNRSVPLMDSCLTSRTSFHTSKRITSIHAQVYFPIPENECLSPRHLGKPLEEKDLIHLHWFKNSEGEYHCPVTYTVFNASTTIVTIRTSGMNMRVRESDLDFLLH